MDRLMLVWVVTVLSHLFIGNLGQRRMDASAASWRRDQANHQPVSYHMASLERLCQLSAVERLKGHLDRILVPRVVGTEGHEQVAAYIEQTLRSFGYSIEHDRFSRLVVQDWKSFTNIIGTLDPSTPRRLTLACHYDSKDMLTRYGYEFLGATDSAFPCSLLLDIAQSLAPYIANREATNVSLQLIFFDGEEAFGDWTTRDSLYGSRHLASIWEGRPYPSYEAQTYEVDRLDLLVLLDLLGSAGSTIPNYIKINDHKTYMIFSEIELQLRHVQGCLDTSYPNAGTIFRGRETFVVEDDQIPFYRQGSSCS